MQHFLGSRLCRAAWPPLFLAKGLSKREAVGAEGRVPAPFRVCRGLGLAWALPGERLRCLSLRAFPVGRRVSCHPFQLPALHALAPPEAALGVTLWPGGGALETHVPIALLPPHPHAGQHLLCTSPTCQAPWSQQARRSGDSLLPASWLGGQNPQWPAVRDLGRALTPEPCSAPAHFCLLTHHKTCRVRSSSGALLCPFHDSDLSCQFPTTGEASGDLDS